MLEAQGDRTPHVAGPVSGDTRARTRAPGPLQRFLVRRIRMLPWWPIALIFAGVLIFGGSATGLLLCIPLSLVGTKVTLAYVTRLEDRDAMQSLGHPMYFDDMPPTSTRLYVEVHRKGRWIPTDDVAPAGQLPKGRKRFVQEDLYIVQSGFERDGIVVPAGQYYYWHVRGPVEDRELRRNRDPGRMQIAYDPQL